MGHDPLNLFEKPIGSLSFYNHRPCLLGFEVKQIHSDIIRRITSESLREEMPEGDGMVVYYQDFPQLQTLPALAIKTADCVPVFIWGEHGYALIHAGWRGIQSKICFRTEIQKLNPKFIYLAPHICQKHYPVGDEFLGLFNQISLKKLTSQWHFSQKDQLLYEFASNYPKAQIEYSNICTLETDSIQSYRRDKLKKSNYTFFIPGLQKNL